MAEYIDREKLLKRFNIDDMMNVNGTLLSCSLIIAPTAAREWTVRNERH